MAKKKDDDRKIVADNRKARFSYYIESSLEAGIALVGSEVKSLRTGKATIGESYAQAKDGEISSSTPISPNTTRPRASATSRAACASCWSARAR